MRQFASFSRLPVRVKALFISVKPLSKLYCVVIYARVVHFMMLRGERIGLFSMTIAGMSQGLKYPLLVKRLACMIISGAESADCIDILQPASLSPELILAMEEGFVMLRSAFKKAGIDDEQMKFLNKQWYTNVLAQIRINAFRIELAGGLYEDLLSSAAASIESEIAVGNAIYMLPSFYNHDCDPNAHIMWIDNADARLMALRDVEEGEELRICYIDASMARDARQAILTQGFGFQCNCLRCSSGD
ncbi:Histone-lysine N-methyltransferase ATXR4 [Citrus sinensis]|nr:Histone-lysine N-methyltransferase ATXR4 [Citrus sinensis]